jgi:hypothetical protein
MDGAVMGAESLRPILYGYRNYTYSLVVGVGYSEWVGHMAIDPKHHREESNNNNIVLCNWTR